MSVNELIDTLKDPNLVSTFQSWCGVRCIANNVGSNSKLKKDTCNDYAVITSGDRRNCYEEKCGEHLRPRKEKWLDSSSDSSANETSHSDSNSEFSNKVHYAITNRFLYYLFSFGAGLGYELFYASFFPIWFWNIDGAVGRRMILIWVFVMYIGQAAKDIVKWPRPASPPVVILEPEYAMEYGMPSTHAMVGSALPFSMLVFTYQRYEYPLWCGVLFATLWCSLVCGSRLYLGMHSVLDIVAGLLFSTILLTILMPLVDIIDQFHLKTWYSPLISIPLIAILAKVYPKSDRWSPARGDTCVIMGAGTGILLGSWLNYQLGIVKGPGLPPPFPIIWPGFNVFGLALLRAIIGIICIIAVRAIGKVLVFSIMCYIHKLNPKDPRTKIRSSVEVPCKLIAYMAMGFSITYVSPAVFRFLNVERITMFTEV